MRKAVAGFIPRLGPYVQVFKFCHVSVGVPLSLESLHSAFCISASWVALRDTHRFCIENKSMVES